MSQLLPAALLAGLVVSAPVLAPLALAQAPVATQTPAGVVTVEAVRLTGGLRASRILGAPVNNQADERIGSVEDLVVTQADRVLVAVIQVGGFLGMGGKLVAVPFAELRFGPDNRVVLPGATKETLDRLPAFTFSAN